MPSDNNTLVLLIEDDPSIMAIYLAYLADLPYQLIGACNGEQAFKILAQRQVDVILLDLNLPDINGLEILKQLRDDQHPSSIIVTTGDCSMRTAINAMKEGAQDYLVKPFDRDRLLTTLKNVLGQRQLQATVELYRDKIDRSQFCGFIGSSPKMQHIYQLIDSSASSKATVFITGQSGTGKELCAEAVHRQSARKKAPFIALNCAAIPRDLIESEIFGHVKGAFTGAINSRDGLAKAADGGTLFLDEICEMDMSLQTRLLRFLQTGTLQKVGSDKTETVDVRIICATNKDPLQAIEQGEFREDLFYRLHVLPIHLPALKDREGDVVDIARHFLQQYSREERKDFLSFDLETEHVLSRYQWPGNIRQLQNVIRNIVVLNNSTSVSVQMLPAPLDALVTDNNMTMPPPSSFGSNSQNNLESPKPKLDSNGQPTLCIQPLAVLEREAIEQAIELCSGNIPRAAHFLEISAATIYRKRNAWRR